MSTRSLPPVRPFIRLYTLHQVEAPLSASADDLDLAGWLIVRVRIETLRYAFAPLSALPLESTYARDPRAGIALARDAVTPRLRTLLDLREPFRELGLFNDGAAHWEQYAAARGLPAEPANIPIARPAARGLPTEPVRIPITRPAEPAFALPAGPPRRRVSMRLAQVQQALELFQAAASTAATLANAWQNWQIGRERRKLLDAQRALLQDAIQAQLAGQTRAFDRALDGDYVRGYLADHGGDAGYSGLFGDADPGANDSQDAS